jgi:hypothetical protein
MGFSKTSFPLYRTLFQMFVEQSSTPVQEKPFRWPFFTMRKIKLTISNSRKNSKLPQELLKLTIDNAGLRGNKDTE